MTPTSLVSKPPDLSGDWNWSDGVVTVTRAWTRTSASTYSYVGDSGVQGVTVTSFATDWGVDLTGTWVYSGNGMGNVWNKITGTHYQYTNSGVLRNVNVTHVSPTEVKITIDHSGSKQYTYDLTSNGFRLDTNPTEITSRSSPIIVAPEITSLTVSVSTGATYSWNGTELVNTSDASMT